MQALKGFGKSYFTFSAMLAFSVQNRLQADVSSILSLLHVGAKKEESELDKNNPLPKFLKTTLISKKRLNSKIRLALLANIFIPRCTKLF